jgi:MOSC domain-containing protein YiiM/predicted N-acetyltransferase YhbS
MNAQITAIYISPTATVLPHSVSKVEARANRGLVGDRYYDGTGTFSGAEPQGPGREVTLIEGEVLDELQLSAEEARRNLVTSGIRLNELVGRQFRVGEVLIEGIRLCPPCTHLDRVTGKELLKPLADKGGLRANLLSDGVIRVGDTVEPLPLRLRRLNAVDETQIAQLADVLMDCVEGGASVSFMQPLTRERALAFWQKVAADVAAEKRALLVAEDSEGICGTVQLIFDLPENQPHRADLAKMLVHRRARRQGLGELLMRTAEVAARESGKTLLVLDCVTGGDAERLYQRLGWVRVGDIPDFALYPEGGLCSTTYYYRRV